MTRASKNEIRLEFTEQIHEALNSLRSHPNWVADLDGGLCTAHIYLQADNEKDRDRYLLDLFEKLKPYGSWQIVGPVCSSHNLNMTEVRGRHFSSWRCVSQGCDGTVDRLMSNLMTFNEVQAALHRARIAAMGTIGVTTGCGGGGGGNNIATIGAFSTYGDGLNNDRLRKQVSELEEKLATAVRERNQAREVVIVQARRITKLGSDNGRLTTENAQLGERNHELKDLPAAADAMFRFLAGIGFQDRSIADQRTFLELMSKLKEELRRAGIGSWD